MPSWFYRDDMSSANPTSMLMACVLLAFTMMLAGCTESAQQHGNGKIIVVASFYPIYDFAKNVGGDRVEVTTLIPMGVEPHEFEPTASDIRKLSEADVFLYNGAGMEPWADSIVKGVEREDLIVADTSAGITLLSSQGHDEHEGDGEEHAHAGGFDPHFWLDPVLAKAQINNIRDALIEADPDGKEYYENNAATYNAKLDSLDNEIRTVMLNCTKHDILVTHATLGYFCKRYGCNQIAINGVDPEAEPSPSDLAMIIDQAKEKNVSVVFFESMIDPRSAQTIAKEINGSVLAFNSVHGLTAEESAAGEDYISLMQGNLANIKNGLECG
jgi:zinc transport system substrate-binding protein